MLEAAALPVSGLPRVEDRFHHQARRFKTYTLLYTIII
jgi:hypothetical protein